MFFTFNFSFSVFRLMVVLNHLTRYNIVLKILIVNGYFNKKVFLNTEELFEIFLQFKLSNQLLNHFGIFATSQITI